MAADYAKRPEMREYQAKQRLKGLLPDDPRHGSINGYTNYACRCEECREAWTTYHRVRNGGTPPKNTQPKYSVKTSTNNRSKRGNKNQNRWVQPGENSTFI